MSEDCNNCYGKNSKTLNDTTKSNSREQWGTQFEFLLACLGNAVGLGNCWRFPYLCYKNGGGAFLIPYIVMVFVIGLPIFLIELSLGQYSAMGPAHLYANLVPIFKGLGMASVISSVIVGVYYNMIIAWTLFYFVESFLGQKWQNCGEYYNSLNCTTVEDTSNSSDYSISSTEEFFNNYVLGISNGIDDIGTIRWKLLLALLIAWIVVASALIKGIKTSGKVVYFTATFPYVILVILFIRGITLTGSLDGLRYYITPNWSRVNDPSVWRDAAIQVFYSFGIGGGGMITYASYNRFHDPVVRHSLLVGIGDFFTSIFCGAVVFAMIGYFAHALNKPIEEIVSSGTGLAFIVIPGGLSQMPLSVVWSMLFFAMLFLLGIDSQFAMVETVITYIFDSFRKSKPNMKLNKPAIVSVTALIWFVCGLPLCTNAGIYILNLMDTYAAGFPYLVIGLLEILIVAYIYGMSNFMSDLYLMTGWNPSMIFRSHVCVMVSTIAPIVIAIILYKDIYGLVNDHAITYGKYVYPSWSTWIGWVLALIPIIAIPIGAIHHIVSSMKSENLLNSLISGFKPTQTWRQNAELNISFSKNYSNNSNNSLIVNENPMNENHILTKLNGGLINPAFNGDDNSLNNISLNQVCRT